jgi:translation elongation factor EF-G
LAALHVADFALVVVHAQHGISVGIERVSNYADECGIPKIIVINVMDRVVQLHRELIELVRRVRPRVAHHFDQGGLSEEEFRDGIHAAVQRQHFIPPFCISAETEWAWHV